MPSRFGSPFPNYASSVCCPVLVTVLVLVLDLVVIPCLHLWLVVRVSVHTSVVPIHMCLSSYLVHFLSLLPVSSCSFNYRCCGQTCLESNLGIEDSDRPSEGESLDFVVVPVLLCQYDCPCPYLHACP